MHAFRMVAIKYRSITFHHSNALNASWFLHCLNSDRLQLFTTNSFRATIWFGYSVYIVSIPERFRNVFKITSCKNSRRELSRSSERRRKRASARKNWLVNTTVAFSLHIETNSKSEVLKVTRAYLSELQRRNTAIRNSKAEQLLPYVCSSNCLPKHFSEQSVFCITGNSFETCEISFSFSAQNTTANPDPFRK